MYTDIDWKKIKTDYVTNAVSYTELSKKYNVPRSTLSKIARKEKWVELKERTEDKVVTKMIASEAKKQISRYEKILSVTDKLIAKIEESINQLDADGVTLDKQGIRAIAGAIKDIKEIQGIKSELDRKEQEARIRKLQKESEDDSTADNKITIEIKGGDESWQS